MVAYNGKKSNTTVVLFISLYQRTTQEKQKFPFRFIYPKQPVERHAMFVLQQRRKLTMKEQQFSANLAPSLSWCRGRHHALCPNPASLPEQKRPQEPFPRSIYHAVSHSSVIVSGAMAGGSASGPGLGSAAA